MLNHFSCGSIVSYGYISRIEGNIPIVSLPVNDLLHDMQRKPTRVERIRNNIAYRGVVFSMGRLSPHTHKTVSDRFYTGLYCAHFDSIHDLPSPKSHSVPPIRVINIREKLWIGTMWFFIDKIATPWYGAYIRGIFYYGVLKEG